MSNTCDSTLTKSYSIAFSLCRRKILKTTQADDCGLPVHEYAKALLKQNYVFTRIVYVCVHVCIYTGMFMCIRVRVPEAYRLIEVCVHL